MDSAPGLNAVITSPLRNGKCNIKTFPPLRSNILCLNRDEW